LQVLAFIIEILNEPNQVYSDPLVVYILVVFEVDSNLAGDVLFVLYRCVMTNFKPLKSNCDLRSGIRGEVTFWEGVRGWGTGVGKK
jgi:hypothetical protein